MARNLGYAIVLVVGLIGGLLIGQWFVPAPVSSPAAERSLPARTASATPANNVQQPGTDEARAPGVAPLAARLLDDGAAVLAEIMASPEPHPERLQALALAALIDPVLLAPYQTQVRGDMFSNHLLMALAYSLFPVDRSHAAELMRTVQTEQQTAQMLAMLSVQMPPAGTKPRDAAIEALQRGEEHHQYVSDYLTWLAGAQPEEALSLLTQYGSSEIQQNLAVLIYQQWLESDPETAVQRLREQGDRGLVRGLLEQIAAQWGSQAFDAAERFAGTLRGTDRVLYLKSLAGVAARGEGGDLQTLLGRYENTPEHEQMLESALRSLSYQDFRSALALADQYPGDASINAYPIIASQYLAEAPEEALDWWESLPAQHQAAARLPIVRHLAVSDTSRALRVSESASAGEDRDKALFEVGIRQTGGDWRQVLTVADRIESPGYRRQLVSNVLRRITDDTEALRVGTRYEFTEDEILALRSGN